MQLDEDTGMGLNPSLTAEDVVRLIVNHARHPLAAREMGLIDDTPENRMIETAVSNTFVFLLRALGYSMDEIRGMLRE